MSDWIEWLLIVLVVFAVFGGIGLGMMVADFMAAVIGALNRYNATDEDEEDNRNG